VAHTTKKVLAFYCSSTSWGGLEMNSVRYALWMKEAGYKVLVYAVRDTPLARQAAMQGLEVRNVQRNRKYFDVLSARRLAKQFQADGIALVWFRDTRDMDTLGWAKRFSLNSFKLLYQQAMQFGVSKRDVFHTARFRPIDAWVSTLDFLRAQVESATRFSKRKIHVVPLGVDTSRLKSDENLRLPARAHFAIHSDVFLFGVLGRLDPLKGQHLAIEALIRLHQKGMHAHLLLAGEATLNEGDDYVKRLHSMVSEFGLEEFVHFKPYSADVQHFYHAIDVFLLCSKGETFGTVTIEAMSCGLPIIGTNSSGTPEILDSGRCGILVKPDEVSELVAAMENCMDSSKREEIREMGIRAKERFHRLYSKETSVKRMIEIVKDCIK
jgi:D-inositol-3-phosphate glycosyltransferase